MWCTKCNRDLNECRCPAVVVGTRMVLCEDGLRDVVEILSDTSEPGSKAYRLKLLEHQGHREEDCALVVGQEFDIFQRTDMGAWSGMWRLERMEL